MKNYTRHVVIRKATDIADSSEKSKHGFKRRSFTEPHYGLVFKSRSTYAENRKAWTEALHMVYSGKIKTIFEAHEIYG